MKLVQILQYNTSQTSKTWYICGNFLAGDVRRRSGVLTAKFEHISHFFSSVSIVNFEQGNASWVYY